MIKGWTFVCLLLLSKLLVVIQVSRFFLSLLFSPEGLEEELRSEAVKMVLEEAIPEPNRRLLQRYCTYHVLPSVTSHQTKFSSYFPSRLLKMMLTVAEFEKINRMNKRAVATCMGPLILRPLMIMDTQEQSPVEGGNMGGRRGGSVGDEGAQIIAAARSAARVQSLIVFLMDNFGQLFPVRLQLFLFDMGNSKPFLGKNQHYTSGLGFFNCSKLLCFGCNLEEFL